jgi:hypothetical protein
MKIATVPVLLALSVCGFCGFSLAQKNGPSLRKEVPRVVISSDDINQKFVVVGPLGFPLGEVATVDGTAVLNNGKWRGRRAEPLLGRSGSLDFGYTELSFRSLSCWGGAVELPQAEDRAAHMKAHEHSGKWVRAPTVNSRSTGNIAIRFVEETTGKDLE